MDLGDSFLMGSVRGDTKHLWIVISDPKKHAGAALIVNLTTNSFRASSECPLSPGDHPWITAPCWASFSDARLISTPAQWKALDDAIRSGHIILERATPTKTLSTILTAARKSRNLPSKYLPYL